MYLRKEKKTNYSPKNPFLSLQPDVVDIKYFKQWIMMLDQEVKTLNPSGYIVIGIRKLEYVTSNLFNVDIDKRASTANFWTTFRRTVYL